MQILPAGAAAYAVPYAVFLALVEAVTYQKLDPATVDFRGYLPDAR